MKMKTAKKLRIEKTVRIVLPKGFAKFCSKCGKEGIFITTEQAVFHFGLSAREIFRLAEAGLIHFYENENGLMFVCANSMANRRKKIRCFKEVRKNFGEVIKKEKI